MGRFDWQEMGLIEVYKYGIGLLGMTLEEVMAMEVLTFVPLVEGNLLMEDERLENMADSIMPFHAKNTAMIVGSSGNMGKGFDPMELASTLYPKEEIWGSLPMDELPKSYEESKEALLSTFEIKEKDIK